MVSTAEKACQLVRNLLLCIPRNSKSHGKFQRRTAQFWVTSGKKRRDCGEEGACNNNSSKVMPYIHWLLQKSDSLEQLHRSLAVREEHGQKSSRCILKSVKASTRGCPCLTHSGDLLHACPVPELPVAWQGTMWGTALQSARENMGWNGSRGAAGSQLWIWGFGLLARSICPSGCGLLCSRPAAGLPAGRWTMPAELSSVLGRRADGAWGCRSRFPPAACTALEDIPTAPGCSSSAGQGGEAQTSISSYASFFFIHRTPSWLGGGAISTGRRKGTAVPMPPWYDVPWSPLSRACVCDLAMKTSARLTAF